MKNELPDFKKHVDQIEVPGKKLDLAVENVIKRGKKKNWSFGKKITFCSSAAAIVFCLLIGSAFISPTMAKVMSNIPYLDQILQSMEQTEDRKDRVENLRIKTYETLTDDNNYEGVKNVIMSWLFSSEPPKFTVTVKDKEYQQEYGHEIKQMIKELAQSYNIDKVKVEVEVQEKGLGNVSKKQMELTNQLFKITEEVLKQEGYNFNIMSINHSKNSIQIEIKATEQQYNKNKGEMEKLVHDTIYAKTQLDLKIEVTRKSESELRDESWQQIFTSVMDESHKEFNEVTGFAYSFHPKPLEIILKTSLSQGKQDQKVAEEIARYAKQIVKVSRNELSIEKIPYKIIIRDKEQENMYEIQVK
ncbi:hypothetical protein GT022_18775 [Agaribacter marinus]|uniref:DUF4179 domain-containing protein n=2 Tax=Virgibacillus TaxID=84406 RepID=A0A941DZT2_9BACI|nr:DUF4179 domain-containing protein [Virgibacillus salarius]MBR7798074.1 DUF4179 domain-containing protein [Virgibacillus salarius]NAZ10782.1 hypothetical protein [Agaribacter marinus]